MRRARDISEIALSIVLRTTPVQTTRPNAKRATRLHTTMGATASTDRSNQGSLLTARTLLLERVEASSSSQPLDVKADDVEALLRKLGPSVARSAGESLHFTCRGLADADIIALGALAVLQPNGLNSLVTINLSHNNIGDKGAVALGKALGAGAPALTRLQLHENRIGDTGAASIAGAMRPGGAPSVQVLRLEFNRISDDGMRAVAEAWVAGGCDELTELYAAGNEITSAGLASLAAALDKVPRLRTLGFGSSSGGNRVGDEGARALMAALKAQPKRPHGVLTINLKTNGLTPAGEAELEESIGDALSREVSISFRSGFSRSLGATPVGAPPPASTRDVLLEA